LQKNLPAKFIILPGVLKGPKPWCEPGTALGPCPVVGPGAKARDPAAHPGGLFQRKFEPRDWSQWIRLEISCYFVVFMCPELRYGPESDKKGRFEPRDWSQWIHLEISLYFVVFMCPELRYRPESEKMKIQAPGLV